MKFLSKGRLQSRSRNLITVAHYGKMMTIAGTDAAHWLAGQQMPAEADDADLINLCGRDLISAVGTVGDPALEHFRILSNCILTPRPKISLRRKTTAEREVLIWLRLAGIRLTAAELVRLRTSGIVPTASLLGEDNRQMLVEEIYTTATIPDLVLEVQMEHSPVMPEVVGALLGLIKKGLVDVC